MATSSVPVVGLSDDDFLTEMDRLTRGHIRESSGALREEFKSEMQRLKQGLSRGPGVANNGPQIQTERPTLELAANNDLAQWVRSKPGRKSFFKGELPLPLGRKAITPITSVVMPQPYPLIQGAPAVPLRLLSLIPSVPISVGAAIWTREVTFTPAAAVVPEGQVKPPTTILFEPVTSAVQTLATVLKVSVQALADMPSLSQWLGARLTYAVELEAEDLLLNAAAPNGVLASGTPLSADFTPGAGSTNLDVLAGAIAQLQSQGFVVDAIVLNARDAFGMRLTKSDISTYVWASPDSPLAAASLWGAPVIISPSMPAGRYAVGGFGQACLYFDRQDVGVETSFENEDDFIRNLATMRAEARGVLAIPVPSGLVVGQFSVAAPQAHAAQPQQHAQHVKK